MKTNALLIAMVLLGAAALAGPAAGLEGSKTNQALSGGERIIVNTVVVPHEYSLVQTQAVISVPGPKGRTDVAVELIAYRHALPRRAWASGLLRVSDSVQGDQCVYLVLLAAGFSETPPVSGLDD